MQFCTVDAALAGETPNSFLTASSVLASPVASSITGLPSAPKTTLS